MRIPFRYESATAEVCVISDETALLHSLFSTDRGRGHASGLMRLVLDWADSKDVVLLLTAQAYDSRNALDNHQLIDFYERYGFVRDSNPPYWPARLERQPSRKIQVL